MKKTALAIASLLLLAACESPTAARPDHRVGVMTDPETGKLIAVAHGCPSWYKRPLQGLENHQEPQFGCADNYNLAHMIDKPGDLVHGRRPGSAEADRGVLGIERYRQDKTKQLINPKEIGTTN